MPNTAANHCKTLRKVSKQDLINALHEALCQFRAISAYETLTTVDNRPTVKRINGLMTKAGHIGFTS